MRRGVGTSSGFESAVMLPLKQRHWDKQRHWIESTYLSVALSRSMK